MEDFLTELRNNTRRNALLIYLDGIFFGLGYAAFFPFTILPGFLTHFSRDPLVINGVVATYSLGMQGTQLITSWLFDSHQQKTGVFLKSSMIFRLAATPLFLLAFFSRNLHGWLLPLFFILYGISVCAWGINAPLWTDLVGRWVEDSRRGRVLGIRVFVGQLAFILGGVLVMSALGTFDFPANYARVFLIGALFWWVSHFSLCYLKEARYPLANPPAGIRDFTGEMAGILRKDAVFRFVVLAFVLSSAHTMSTALYTTISLDRLYAGAASAVRDEYIGRCSLILNMSSGIAALIAAWLMRKRNTWFVLGAGYLCLASAAFGACFASSVQGFGVTLALNGVFLGFDAVASVDLLLRLTPVEHRLRYIGMANTARGIAAGVFPFLGGILAKNSGATATFFLTALLGVVASVVLYAGAPKQTSISSRTPYAKPSK
jgi:MFS family permease